MSRTDYLGTWMQRPESPFTLPKGCWCRTEGSEVTCTRTLVEVIRSIHQFSLQDACAVQECLAITTPDRIIASMKQVYSYT
jgi:hypothetical protein